MQIKEIISTDNGRETAYNIFYIEYSPGITEQCSNQKLCCHQKISVLKDATDGSLYKELSNKANREGPDVYDIMLMLNTDGAPVFESQKFSIWPLYAGALELVAEKR